LNNRVFLEEKYKKMTNPYILLLSAILTEVIATGIACIVATSVHITLLVWQLE